MCFIHVISNNMTLCFKVQSLCGVVHFLTEHLFYLNSLIFLLKFEMCTIAKRMSKKKKKIEGHCDSIIYTFTERERKVKMHLLSSTSSSVPRLHLLVTMVSSGLLTTQGSHWKNIWITIICSSGPHDDIPKEITSFSE